jgi:uncharacterized protein YjbJ (UPF0337 family)
MKGIGSAPCGLFNIDHFHPGALSAWGRRNLPDERSFAQDSNKWRLSMDKDRIEGSAEQAKGKIKEVAGKVTGDSKLEGEGKADQVKGKIQNTVGGIKDTLRGK